jgi:putative nucleotidyltransferase with HDIG domain
MARNIGVGASSTPRRSGSGATPARRSPRLVARVLAASFVSALAVLAVVGAVLVMHARATVERGAGGELQAAHRQMAASLRLRHQDALLRATLIGVDDELERVLLAYQDGRAFGDDPDAARAQLDALQRRIAPAARHLDSDVMAITGWDGRIIASAGARAADWSSGARVLTPAALEAGATEVLVSIGGVDYWATAAPIALDDLRLGHLVEAHVIDDRYAASFAGDTRSDVVIVNGDRLLAATSPAATGRGVVPPLAAGAASGTFEAGGTRYAFLLLRRAGPAAAYAVASMTASRDRIIAGSAPTLAAVALGAVLLCAIVSAWLAERVATPIDQVSRAIGEMVEAGAVRPIDAPAPSIHELDALAESFNRLVRTVADARGETEATCLDAISALAAALDARDPNTAGHAERVSRLAMAMGRELGLGAGDLEILRFGALLHDIGKIGISDVILRKPSQLSHAEYEAIKQHTVLGARILEPVAFLTPHIPIVELHHERPDGTGYPHGLRGDEIPLLARIVHVADAFDAMTTARTYRSARPDGEVLAELRAGAGTAYDGAALEALERVLSAEAERRAS